jgi:hypothetical protein
MADFKWEVVEKLGVLSENPKGWTKELNRVSWNGREAKFDIREWSPDGKTMSKGMTFTDEEMEALKDLLNQIKPAE